MNTEKYKRVAKDCADILASGYVYEEGSKKGLVEPYEPAEFQMGLTLALAMYFKAMFPTELMEVYKLHCQSMLLTLEELDAKGHKDDMLDISGVTL